jgi:putative membrane protein
MSGGNRDIGRTPAADPRPPPSTVIEDDSTGEVQGTAEADSRPLAVVIETDDESPIRPAIEAGPPTSPAPVSRRGWGAGTYALRSLALLVAIYWAVSFGDWADNQFRHHGALGYALLPILCAVLFFAACWLWREVSAWRRLVVVERLRADLSDVGQSEPDKRRFLAALRHLEATMEGSQKIAIAGFLNTTNDNRSADELRVIFNHAVLYPMDEAATGAVHRAARDSFFLALISPTPVTDTIAFVVRATAMIRGVAIAYGHRPGKFGLYRLIRRMIADIALLSGLMILMGRASSVVGRVIRQGSQAVSGTLKMAGDPVIGRVVGAAGALAADATDAVAEEIVDALAAATRMAQLGLLAVAVSRPVELSVERRREISSRLRKMLLTLRRTGRQNRALQAEAPASLANP